MAAGLGLVATATRPLHADDAKPVYDKSCANCHGVSGKGDGPASKMLKPPPPEMATAIKGMSDADLTKIIKEGGKAVGKSSLMPAFGSKLKDDQIQSLVEYVKGFK